MTNPIGKLGFYTNAVPVSKSDDSANNIPLTRGLYVGVAGDVVAVINGVNRTFKALPVGFHPISTVRIHSTGTAATDMLAMY